MNKENDDELMMEWIEVHIMEIEDMIDLSDYYKYCPEGLKKEIEHSPHGITVSNYEYIERELASLKAKIKWCEDYRTSLTQAKGES